jgi:transcriptional regulator with GAF, ATPase, and Fis domain
MTRLDRTEFVGHLAAAPAFDERGALLGLIAVITDQTERDQHDCALRALELQTETLAMFGAQALRQRANAGKALRVILTESVEATRRLLEADHVTVFDVIAGTDDLVVRAGSSPIGERTAVASGSGSFAGYTVLARKVTVVHDTRHDRRFEAGGVRPGFQAASAIGAPIFGPDGMSGVLTVESSTASKFDHAAAHFVQGMANIIGIALLP